MFLANTLLRLNPTFTSDRMQTIYRCAFVVVGNASRYPRAFGVNLLTVPPESKP